MSTVLTPSTKDNIHVEKNTEELRMFDGQEVEIFTLNGEILFNPYHVGACLELSNDAVRKAMSRMNDKQVIKVKNSDVTNGNISNSDVGLTNFRKLNNAGENFLTESGVYKLVFKSRKPNAEKFTDWIAEDVLPSVRKTGQYKSNEKSESQSAFMLCLQGVKFVADDMKLAESSRLMMYNGAFTEFGLPTSFLPHYEDNGNRERCSATELLNRNHCGMSAAKFNQLLLDRGFLEIKERKSSKGTTKPYKVLTVENIKKNGMDNPIGDDVFSFLWDWMNDDTRLYTVAMTSIISAVSVLSGGSDPTLDFLSEIGVDTYTHYEDEGIMINNSTGETVKVSKPKRRIPKYLKVVGEE